MSKIVILKTNLGAPQIIQDLLDGIASKNPSLADWISQFNSTPLIKECAINAIKRIGTLEGVKSLKSQSKDIVGILKKDDLPYVLEIKILDNGVIEFKSSGDDYYHSGWKGKIGYLRSLFTDAFLAEVNNSIFQILGYESTIQMGMTADKKITFFVDGNKEGKAGATKQHGNGIFPLAKTTGTFDRRYVHLDEAGKSFRFDASGNVAYLKGVN